MMENYLPVSILFIGMGRIAMVVQQPVAFICSEWKLEMNIIL